MKNKTPSETHGSEVEVRARWVKPEFFEDQKMAELGPVGALVYQSLWVSADDTGMAMCDPNLLKGKMFTRWSAVGVREITGALRKLSELGRVQFFRGGDELFAQIVRWKENQAVHKPSKFTYRDDYSKRGKDLRETVPEWCGTSAALVRESPPPRHLDSQTPRHLAEEEASSSVQDKDRYYIACTVALNTGMQENPTVEGEWIPVSASSQVARVTWCEDDLPLGIVEEIILERAKAYRCTAQNRGPRSLKYFDRAVRETWERGHQSRSDAKVSAVLGR